MFKLIPPIKSIGLECSGNEIKIAEITQQRGSPYIEKLFTMPLSPAPNVNPLYKDEPLLTTGIDGYDVLLRLLHLPLTKEKDVNEALIFQAEPLLPYPIDQAVLAKQKLNQSSEGTDLNLFSIKKEALQAHLNKWQLLQIEPEKVACLQAALCQFGKTYLSAEKALILVHVQEESTTCVLMQAGKLVASFTHQEGLNLLQQAIEKDHQSDAIPGEPADVPAINFDDLSPIQYSHLTKALKRLQMTIAKLCFALAKELKGVPADGIILTGDGARMPGLSRALLQNLPCPIWTEDESAPKDELTFEEKLCYAAPIGLAINSLPACKDSIDFRQADFSYPHPWKRVLKPVAAYFACMLALSAIFYFFSQKLLQLEEYEIKQNYIDLLANMGKSYDQFETSFMAKNPSAKEKSQGEVLPLVVLDREDLQDRLSFLQNDIQSTPDTFPLFANVPRVSDVLAWLSQHPAVKGTDETGAPENRLQLENFSYVVLKRPEHGKKQEKYQVKVELEFSSPTPKWAREFHDALIAPNEFVDAKAEIKWNSNRGKYKTSFFLKDKTSYL